ncbi:MAG: hypothetical protein HYV63_08715 [Candidatus Schekmanbacteria bacterium]|nr:hypothetical protein [Candidatus Schekmanbacteria bacterium]
MSTVRPLFITAILLSTLTASAAAAGFSGEQWKWRGVATAASDFAAAASAFRRVANRHDWASPMAAMGRRLEVTAERFSRAVEWASFSDDLERDYDDLERLLDRMREVAFRGLHGERRDRGYEAWKRVEESFRQLRWRMSE